MSIMKTKNKTIYTNNFTNEDYKINLLPNRLHYISLSRNLPHIHGINSEGFILSLRMGHVNYVD